MCTSFIFFKEDFTDLKRTKLQSISHRLLSSISIESNTLVNSPEFEFIWRWLFFKRIVSDNEEYQRNLFVDNDNWREFEKRVNQIKDPVNKKKSIIPNKIKIAVPYKDPNTLSEIAPEMEIDLQNRKDEKYLNFIQIIDDLESRFARLSRTDIPYYIFVDELEAYYGDSKVFQRDLTLIRDLIFTVKHFNGIFARTDMKSTKIICSVRSEILNAISRFIVTKEINKSISGFSVPLNWMYTNTSSFMHPIMQILLKRIIVCDESFSGSFKEIYNKWFPEKIHEIEPANYILNNSWHKPRDMVRLLTTAKNSVQNNNSAFTQAVFSSINKSYSEESLIEIKEELRALYNPEEIDVIINCFMGYKTTFSANQLKHRISTYFQGTVLDTDFVKVIDDLYRLGFLGNFIPASKAYRWQHKGDERVILTDEWRLFVHYALHKALSLGARQNFGMNRGELPEIGDVVLCEVLEVTKSFAFVEFEKGGEPYKGCIHISEFGKLGYGYIQRLSQIVHIGDKLRVSIQQYNSKYQNWKLSILDVAIQNNYQ